MPLGAFIFIDFWLFPRLGLARYYAEQKGLLMSWPAAAGWFGSFGICFLLSAKDQYQSMGWINNILPAFLANYKSDLFLQVLPAWLIAVTLYLVCSLIQQKMSPISQEQTK
jgi:hypothetical protein